MRRTVYRYIASIFCCILMLFLIACSGNYYTEDIRKDYEKECFSSLTEYFAKQGIDSCTATMALFVPGGVTRLATGRFFLNGIPVQYVYDASENILWAGHTKYGFFYSDAKHYIEKKIGLYLTGSGISDVDVRSFGWVIPYTEYLYDVETANGEFRLRSKNPEERNGYLRRSFLVWEMQNDEAESFLDELLHGSPDLVTDLSIDVFCDSFEDSGCMAELHQHALLQAFSGIRTVRIYERAGKERYYQEEVQEDGSIEITWHESVMDSSGNVRWKTSVWVPDVK